MRLGLKCQTIGSEVPAGCEDGHTIVAQEKGDAQEHTRRETLRFRHRI